MHRMKADTAFLRLEKGLRNWEAVCNGPKMNFHPACFAALKSKHSNKQMNKKPSPPARPPVLFQVWCCDGTCIAVYATVLPSPGDAFSLSCMSSPSLVTPIVKGAVMSPPCLRDVWDLLVFQYWKGGCAYLPSSQGDILVLTPWRAGILLQVPSRESAGWK